jgi:diguanylate cyclase (GGDEF)-like protein
MESSAAQRAPAAESPEPATERCRLAELSRYAITLDRADPKLDRVTALAMQSLGADIGGISIVFQSQIWLPSRIGVEARHLPRTGSFCTWVLATASDADFFEVEDARADPRFNTNPLVTRAPHYVHYAAVPLHGARGYLLGTLWVMGRQPRRLAPEQVLLLQGMARLAVDTLELRYCSDVTGMPNRRVFLHHLQLGLEQTAQPHVVVGFVDLIGFRQLNEVFGREQGNEVLRAIGQRVRAWAGPDNLSAHLGGDKFAFALFGRRERLVEMLEQLKQLISQPLALPLAGGPQVLHARIGVEHHATPFTGSAATLLDAADAAAAAIPGGHLRSTVKEYGVELLARSHMVYELQGALDGDPRHGVLVVHYQPQVNYLLGSVVGLEALARWQHPARGLIPPNNFVPLAEGCDKIYQLDRRVLAQVCSDMRVWQDAGLPVVPVSLNFSRRSLLHPQVIADLQELLARYRIHGHMLELEVTESLLLETLELAAPRVAEFRALGVRIAVDDFGTGYSNLDAISSFSFDRLKVDRQFINGVAGNARTAGLFHLIQGIAELFQAELLCEGLEQEDDLEWLAERGAACVQGWYFSPARTPDAIVRVLGALRARALDAPPLSVPQLRQLLKA